MNMPHLSHLPPVIEEALQEQAQAIWSAYVNGNKSTARAMIAVIPEDRKCYVTAWVIIHAQRCKMVEDAYRLICSVTK